MKKKVLAALLVYAMTVSAAVTPVFADGGRHLLMVLPAMVWKWEMKA